MHELFLIRHGHYDPTTQKITPLGKKQMKGLAARIQTRAQNPITLYSSPMMRATDSAKELARHLGVEDISICEELKEGMYDWKSDTIAKAYECIMDTPADQSIAVLTHRNTGVSIANKISNEQDYEVLIKRPMFHHGLAIYFAQDTKKAQYF